MEQQLQFRIPCWVVAEAASERGPLVTVMRSEGKSIIQLFLEKEEAERFIKEAGLTGKAPFMIQSIQFLAGLLTQLQNNGVEMVYVFFQAGGEFKRAALTIADFAAGIQKHLPI